MGNIANLALFAIVVVTWSTTWTAMSIAVDTIPPITATALRFLIASPILIVMAKVKKAPLLFPPGQRGFQVFLTIGYFAVPVALIMYGEKHVNPGLAALIFANMPVVVLLLSAILLKEKIYFSKLTGLVLAWVALSLILRIELDWSSFDDYLAPAALLLAVLMHGFAYVSIKKRCCSVPILTFNALPCTMAGISLLVLSLISESPSFDRFSGASIAAISYLGLVANVIGVMCFFWLQRRTTAFSASLTFVAFPIFAIVLDGFITGRSLNAVSWILLAPLLVGLLIMTYSPKESRASS
ncbi:MULTISPECIES: DMT family transporter [unclassified Caballeronia]|uniref:DMT family transporter n=1 Tax=unclassified Caballeronia TaxID=2646786 RepID=UPI0028637CAD|nr:MULTISPECIES: DMT family transporter [unclassified Caballeronia]MDR5777687.1 DMT family transporter [Caballeronia sp. LZ002]MDR5805485.1 DMT family transporter [Caballeronia sp. LZ001]MDR5853125.1 DMT family transporter [Caballeronia sp. LZ003]